MGIVSRVCNPTRAYLPLALFVINYFTATGDFLSSSGRIFTGEKIAPPETTSLQGKLEGLNLVTHHNRTVYGFMGIPFAVPPIGNLRFRAPVAAGTWNGTLQATSKSSVCTQIDDDGKTVIGEEDCLHLHVYTPRLPSSGNSTLLPVMVYIFGGGFKAGFPNPVRHGPNFLLDHDVVLVVPNYRLGPLGFLSTGDEVSPGNYGLKDNVLALKWIRDNIQYFGGDPNQVTLFGASSGGINVGLLALSGSTEGLFHKYITQSGSVFNAEISQPTEVVVNRGIKLAKNFDCPTHTSTLLVECLRRINASQLVDTNSLFLVWKAVPNLIFSPTVEPDIEGAFLTDSPRNLLAGGKIRDLPSISLVARDEGLVHTLDLYEDPELCEDFLKKIHFLLPYRLGYWSSVDNVTAYTTALMSYYLKDLTANRSLVLKNLTQLVGDALFVYPTFHVLQRQLALAKNPTYFCSFEYRGVFSYTYFYSGNSTKYTQGVAHCDEIIYLFHNFHNRYGPPHYKYSDVDWTMVDTMVQLWTSFAINGKPTAMDSNGTTIWEPYSSRNNYLRIGNGCDTALEMKYHLYIERMRFWDDLLASTSGKFKN